MTKKCLRWTVILMCLATLLSLFGCNKDKYILDGPGMERVLGWKSFTISRCTEMYDPIYSYTVKYDSTTCEAYLYSGTVEEQAGIRLESQTVNALFDLKLLDLPDEGSVTGNFLCLSVVDENGTQIHKDISTVKESEILALIRPYVDDDSDTEGNVWQEFTISQNSDVYEDNFAYTVTKEADTYYLSYEYFDYENKVPDERKIPLKNKTVNSLLALDLLSLPDVQPVDDSSEEEMILDGTWAKLTVVDEAGNRHEKSVSTATVDEIRSLLAPYVKD